MASSRTVAKLLVASVFAVVVVGVVGCRRDTSPAQSSGDSSAPVETDPPPQDEVTIARPEAQVDEASGLSLRLGLDSRTPGVLGTPVLSFGRGDRVCVEVERDGAPAGQALTVIALDALGEELSRGTGALSGTPPRTVVCLSGTENLDEGSYALSVELDGQEIGGMPFSRSGDREEGAALGRS